MVLLTRVGEGGPMRGMARKMGNSCVSKYGLMIHDGICSLQNVLRNHEARTDGSGILL